MSQWEYFSLAGKKEKDGFCCLFLPPPTQPPLKHTHTHSLGLTLRLDQLTLVVIYAVDFKVRTPLCYRPILCRPNCNFWGDALIMLLLFSVPICKDILVIPFVARFFLLHCACCGTVYAPL